jgi:hypothetical protein
MNKICTFSQIKPPFFVDSINSMVLNGQMESSYGDFQESLNLSDEQVDQLDAQTDLTDFECFNGRGEKITYTIADNAEITCDESGVFSTVDIFGETLNFAVGECSRKIVNLRDILALHPITETPTLPHHQVVLNWIAEHGEKINQLIDVSYFITDEYTPSQGDEHLLFRGDLHADFKINGQSFYIASPSLLSLKEVQGQIVLESNTLDISTDQVEHYESIVSDMDQLKWNEIEIACEAIEAAFYEHFTLEKVPMWQTRVLNSFKHDDLLGKLKELKASA